MENTVYLQSTTEEKILHIFLAPSLNWREAVATAIASVAKRATIRCLFHVVVFEDVENLHPKFTKYILSGLAAGALENPNMLHSFSFHTFDRAILNDFKTCSRFTQETFVRAFLPYFFTDIDEGIYLDCDILARKDIRGLVEICRPNLDNFHLSGTGAYCRINTKEYDTDKHFNAGVLYMNFAALRRDFPKDVLIELFLTAFALGLKNDEEPLNWFCQKKGMKFFLLPQEWNSCMFLIKHWERRIERARAAGVSEEEISVAMENPAIVHFTGSVKPWISGETLLPRNFLEEWKAENRGVNKAFFEGGE